MGIDIFKKKFNMPDNLYEILSDGNTQSLYLRDINNNNYSITFNNGTPFIKKVNSKFNCINRTKVDSLIKENIIYKYLEKLYLN